jgi:hypothetical protein
MTGETAEYYSDPDTHLGRLVAYAYQLGTRPEGWTTDQQKQEWHDTFGRLRRWTHMLGFGGHFATKSRRYSTTHKHLRAARREYQRSTRADWHDRFSNRVLPKLWADPLDNLAPNVPKSLKQTVDRWSLPTATRLELQTRQPISLHSGGRPPPATRTANGSAHPDRRRHAAAQNRPRPRGGWTRFGTVRVR